MVSAAEELRARANQAFEAGRLDEALKCFSDLERGDGDPEWSKRVAQVHHQLGDSHEEVEALNRAARGYVARGEILKAAVTSKLILSLHPGHIETLRRIPDLVAARDKQLPARPPVLATPDAAHHISEAIHTLYLREVIPRSKPVHDDTPGVYRIPLGDDVSEDLQFEITVDDDPAPADEMRVDRAGNLVRAMSTTPDLLIKAVEREVQLSQTTNDALKGTPFAELSPKTFSALLLNARLVELAKDAELFHQGDPGDALYVVASGTLGVVEEGPPRRGVAKIGERQVFGEIALLTDLPRTATILALTDATLIAIDRAAVKKLSAVDPQFLGVVLRFLRNRLVDRLMTTNPLFTALSERDCEALRRRFRLLEVDAGAALIEEGKKPDGLIIFLAGRAEVTRLRAGKSVKLGELSPGDIAGEISLLTNIPAIGTVRATERCLAIQLPAEAFQTIVHARPDAMKFVQQLIEQRVAQAKKIIAGDAPHVEGNVLGM